MIKYFKNPKHATHLMHVHPMTALVIMDMLLYIQDSGYNPLITSFIRTPDDDRRASAKHDTHQSARSVDIRCHDWSNDFKEQFEKHFENKYKGHGAISAKTGQENLIEIHGEGDNEHVHVQMAKIYGNPLAWMKI
jgi:hypothetical protein